MIWNCCFQNITGIRLSELSNTISTKADKTRCPLPSCKEKNSFKIYQILQLLISPGYELCHTWSSACLSSLPRFWKRSLNTKRMAGNKRTGETCQIQGEQFSFSYFTKSKSWSSNKYSGTGNGNFLTIEKISFTRTISTNCKKEKNEQINTIDVAEKYNHGALIWPKQEKCKMTLWINFTLN